MKKIKLMNTKFLMLMSFISVAACTMDSDKNPVHNSVQVEAFKTNAQLKESSSCELRENCDCPAPGSTLLYALNYCFGQIETDDCESAFGCLDEIKSKFKNELENKSECEQNQLYRKKYCEQFHKDELQKCLKEIPNIVRTGC